MFFWLLKAYAQVVLPLYCRKIFINKPELLQATGPLLIAANHPNSFLDGVILTTLFQNPIYSLARGDAFKQKKWNRLLRSLHLLPVYRTSEGVENLSHNYTTFAACKNVFARNGIVLIFSEGRCINEWHLRPLKKGTGRLALSAWEAGQELTVIPLGFNYSPFRRWGKTVHLNFGEPLQKSIIRQHDSEGKQLLAFNMQLEAQLQQLVYEVKAGDEALLKKLFFISSSTLKLFLLALPAALGWLLHAPFYYTARAVTNAYFDNDHYDSVVVSLAMLCYPFYLVLCAVLAGIFWGWPAAIILIGALPFCAWACLHWKHQLDY
ncbi:MAG TPA: 1-acyl-sn-glycerol-3-phosphate acyltransferase [Chitinophagaceae bacterium]|nr:1-acyl-sn-glycerol-3-phosphate acyltransferase [Chitinophagaceae bacterium]